MFSYKNNNLLPLLITSSRRNDNSSVILFTNARDEPNIAEWIAHHLLLGFDKIVVFDHLSKIPIQSVIKNNFKEKVQVIMKFEQKGKFVFHCHNLEHEDDGMMLNFEVK